MYMSKVFSSEIQAVLDATRKAISETEQKLSQLRHIESTLLGKPVTPDMFEPGREFRDRKLTLGDAAAKVMADQGRPMHTDDIAKMILDQKLYSPPTANFRAFSNSVFSTLKRKEDVFCKYGPGIWDLVKKGDPK